MREVDSRTRFAVIANVACILLAQGESKNQNITCNGNLYRSADGLCNNLWHPEWGSSNREFARLLPPTNDDYSKELPPIEQVSQKLVPYLKTQTLSHLPRTGVFQMWTELLNLDLNLPSENNPTKNDATSYLDASFLYNPSGSVNFTESLENGDLAFHGCKKCQSVTPYGITSILLLFHEHNRVADILRKINPHWDGATVFEESRRVIIAEIQHITYTQYLPLLLGEISHPEVDSNVRLNAQSNYDKELAVEVYYTLVDVLMKALKKNFQSVEESDSFSTNNLLLYSKQAIPDLPRSLNREDIEEMLLVSRQHKLRPYTDWIEFCKNHPVTSASYYSSHSKENQNSILNAIYKKPSDIELVAGALAEKVLSNGMFGSTMQCLATIQFTNIKNGDRHWYTHKNHRQSFSVLQLRELERVTMSGLICANANQQFIQKSAFLVHDLTVNEAVMCTSVPSLSLINWNKNHNVERLRKEQIIKEAIRKAEDDLGRRRQTEFLLWSQKGGVDPKSPIGTAAAFSKPNRNALLLANNSILLEYASKELQNIMKEKLKSKRLRRQIHDSDDPTINISDEGNFLQDIDISTIIPDVSRELENSCPAEIAACDPSYPYRSFTGYCNNLRKPNWGKSLTTFARILPPAYDNGISKPRYKSVMGIPLPSARLISSMMHLDVSNLDSKHSMMLMQFAQFLDHDITFTPVQKGFFASIPDCRPCDSPQTVHPECMPIEVPAGDPYYPQVNFTTGQRFCLPFMRSLPGQQRLGARDQINQNSAFLDLSQVYGDNACLARQLRGYQGRLNTTISLYGDKELLPQSPTHPECKATSGYCFIAGDGRASEQPGLTSIHTVFMREHNRLADSLRSLNPHWEDERLYQQARKIFIGQYQHIIYNEFLPRLLGPNTMNVYGLNLESLTHYFTGYTKDCNPSALTEFASAAFRIGHSLLRPFMPRMSSSYQPLDPPILLRDTFFNPDIIYQRHIIDEISRGLLSTPVETLDQFITKEITNHLFEDKKVPFSGMDLPALNVQRARDHGIPSYNEFRAMCNLKRAATWEDFSKELPADVITRLKRLYPTIDDVDLFPAGISENPVPGGLVGPTFACIISIQYRQLRKCDRFWYETSDPLLKFSPEQLIEIRKAVLSRIICDNLDVPSPVQRWAFDLPSEENPRVPCQSLPRPNLKAWQESQNGCHFRGRFFSVGESYLPTPCTSCICTTQGVRCATIRVTNCIKLIQEVGQAAVLRDEVCSIQCSSYITLKEDGTFSERLPEGRGVHLFKADGLRPPPIGLHHRRKAPTTRSFKLRDFAIVVG